MIRVLIVEDQRMAREDMENYIQSSGRYCLAASITNAAMAETVCRQSRCEGIFGGEGFIMQRLSGNGTAFVEIDGHAVEYDLSAGQEILISTGYLAAMEETCTMDVVAVKGVKNMLIGGEGIFNTVVKGPGKVILQTMPISKVAELLTPFFADKK